MAAALTIRPLRTPAELDACVALQRRTWGEEFDELVPPSLLTVTQKIGGVAAGAFGDDGTMLGFVFGLPGVREGRVIHWSDMLAVRPDARDRGVGRALKEFQRRAALASGATTMYWSYDPLVARNAYLNFNRLGARVSEYVEDMYGSSTSELHRGLGTDRFIVAWELSDDRSTPASATPREDWRAIPVLEARATPSAGPPRLRVQIPSDILAVRDTSPGEAVRWRAETRAAFQWALANGYTVERFVPDGARGWYLLGRAPERG